MSIWDEELAQRIKEIEVDTLVALHLSSGAKIAGYMSEWVHEFGLIQLYREEKIGLKSVYTYIEVPLYHVIAYELAVEGK